MASEIQSTSIILPFKMPAPHLKLVIQAILALKPAPQELILVADGCNLPFAIPTSEKADVKLMELKQTRGPATARNIGAATAKGDLLLFVDADVILPHHSLSLISEFFQQGGKAAIADYSASPPLKNAAGKYKNSYMRLSYSRFPPPAVVPAFLTSAAVCTRQDFQKIGGFNEGYRLPSVEDAEFGQRLARAKISVLKIEGWSVYHLHDYSVVELIRVAFRRAAAIVRLKLRTRDQGNGNKRTAPPGYRISLLLPITSCFFVVYALMMQQPWFHVLAGFSWGLMYLLNYPLFRALNNDTDVKTILFSLLYVPLDLLFHFCGIIWGFMSYWFGTEY